MLLLVYGYGTIAIAFISGLSLLGVCLLPCMKKKIYEKVLIVLTGLAIGSMNWICLISLSLVSIFLALICDAVLHILPDLFKMSLDASDDTSVDSSKIVIKASVPFSCVILFSKKIVFCPEICITNSKSSFLKYHPIIIVVHREYTLFYHRSTF